jgi:hypothetical protein
LDFIEAIALCVLYAIALTLKLYSKKAAGEMWKKAASSFI